VKLIDGNVIIKVVIMVKRKKKSTLDRLYSYDKRNNAYKIEISLDKYEDIYNEWDPTPFKKRDIEEEFIQYVIDSSTDIPMKYNLDLELYLPEKKKDETKEKNAKAAIKSYFNYLLDRNKRTLKTAVARCLRSAFIGIVLLTVYYVSLRDSSNGLARVFIEGISILGWVALWDVGEELLLNIVKTWNKRRNLKRISKAKVEFIYK
jgi:hypothetical protein